MKIFNHKHYTSLKLFSSFLYHNFSQLALKFNTSFSFIPHESKRDKGGEDAYAIHDGMICVADGVGGWNLMGVDPGKYSRELCNKFSEEYTKSGINASTNPKNLFIEACNKTKSVGTSTFCMCMLDFTKDIMHTVNLGDSGYMIIRTKENILQHNSNPANSKIILNRYGDTTAFPADIIHKSEEQTRGFNFPLQVGTGGDDPNLAETKTHHIMANDVIILGTDGLWDNLYAYDILRLVIPFMEENPRIGDLKTLSGMMGEICEVMSTNPKHRSPFAKRSDWEYMGGKPDDITIIIAQIVKNEKLFNKI